MPAFFADSVFFITNGVLPKGKTAIENASKNLEWWENEFVSLEIKDNKPAYPDAIDYKEAGVWVQDWLLLTARNIKTGINISLPVHNLYSFNDDGKIFVMYSYFDNSIFEEITNSQAKKENGKIYINHPHIAVVRKVVNAYMDKNAEEWASYFSPKARFGHYGLGIDETMSYEENMKELKKVFSSDTKTVVEEIGYPDCIFNEESGQYTVYSWWKVMKKNKDGKEVYSVILTHNFDDKCKIVFEDVYLTSKRK